MNDNTERMQQAWTSRDRARALDAAQDRISRKGCGKLTHVSGTNGGRMPCGAMLTDLKGNKAPYYCATCEPFAPPLTEEQFKELLATAYAALLPHGGSLIQQRGKP